MNQSFNAPIVDPMGMAKEPDTGPTPPASPPVKKITLERTLRVTARELWDLWTTRKGFESWWGPEGFVTKVRRLEVSPGGKFEYEMTATGAEQVEALKKAKIPLTSRAHGSYKEVRAPKRLVYKAVADFIPGVPPYEKTTLVEFQIVPGGTKLTVIEDAMHNEEWTRISDMGMGSSLDKLIKVAEGKRRT